MNLRLWLFLTVTALAALPAVAQEGVKEKRPAEEAPQPKLTKAPELVTFVEAIYPNEALDQKLQGAVEMMLTLDAEGKVTKVEVTKPAGNGFDEAAVTAAEQFVFSPAEVDGKPSPIMVGYTYNFKIDTKVISEGVSEEEKAISIKGRLREKGVKLPVVGGAVSVEGTDIEVTTDKKGRFKIEGLAPGTYTLVFVSPEYKKTSIQAVVKEDAITELDVFMELEMALAYETVVKGKLEETVVTKYTLKKQEIQTVPGTFGDPIRVVENLPGVARSSYTGGGLFIRGANPGESAYYIDGVAIPALYHFFGGPSVFSPEFFDKIDFYPGNFGAKYGRATGGIVEVGTLSQVAEEWFGIADINLLNAAVYLEAPLTDTLSIKVAGRRSYYDAIIPLVLNAAGEEGTTLAPVYYDYQLRVDWMPNPKDRFSIFMFGSDDRLELITEDDATASNLNFDSITTFHRVVATWNSEFTSSLRSKLSPYLGFDFISLGTDVAFLDNTIWNTGLRWDLSWKLADSFKLNFGNDTEFASATFQALAPSLPEYAIPGQYQGEGGGAFNTGAGGPPDELETLEQTFSYLGTALYVEGVWDVGAGVTLIPGFRLDYLTYLGEHRLAPDPRLTVKWATGFWDVTLKAGAGIYHRLPDFFAINDTFGNPGLSLEYATQYSAGFEKRFTDNLSLDVQGFLVYRYNRAVISSVINQSDDGLEPEYFTNDGKGRSYGAEIILKHDLSKHFYGWIAYTLSKTEFSNGPGQPFEPYVYDQTHNLIVVASFKFGDGWQLGFRFRLVSGNRYTPFYGGTFKADEGRYTAYSGAAFSKTQVPFNQLDVRLEKTWTFQTWALTAYLDVQNVYWADNPEFTQWDYRYEEQWQVPGLPILPSFGVKGRF